MIRTVVQRMVRPEFVHAAALSMLMVPGIPACDRDRSTNDPPGATPADSAVPEQSGMSPANTVNHVRRLRTEGRLAELEACLGADQRRDVVELIQSVDQLLYANRILQRRIETHLGMATAAAFDRSQAANAIGVFSRDVEVISERVDGDRAVVLIQVAGRVPLEEVHLHRVDGAWRLTTDPPIAGVAQEIRNLADVLLRCSRRAEHPSMTAAKLRTELRAMEAPIGQRLVKLTLPRNGAGENTRETR